jgi:hypothetical protein
LFDVAVDQTLVVVETTADFDDDHDIDATDLAMWNTGFGMAAGASHEQGDADGDFAVDGADFLAWQQQLGSGMSSPAESVPEPTPLVILISGMLATLRGRRICPS